LVPGRSPGAFWALPSLRAIEISGSAPCELEPRVPEYLPSHAQLVRGRQEPRPTIICKFAGSTLYSCKTFPTRGFKERSSEVEFSSRGKRERLRGSEVDEAVWFQRHGKHMSESRLVRLYRTFASHRSAASWVCVGNNRSCIISYMLLGYELPQVSQIDKSASYKECRSSSNTTLCDG